MEPIEIQRRYYEETAKQYDSMHLSHGMESEHDFALAFLSSIIDFLSIQSILDVGAGTGRAISTLQSKHPGVALIGIEPVKELREIGYEKRISRDVLIDGNGNQLDFEDDAFDIVCEFGVLHHVSKPEEVVKEMLRVARVGIFISDSNNFGQGNFLSRFVKQTLDQLRLWRAYDFCRTKGKMYQVTEGDGLFYSYSVFNNLKTIKLHCKSVHILNTKNAGGNPYKTAPHVALLGLK